MFSVTRLFFGITGEITVFAVFLDFFPAAGFLLAFYIFRTLVETSLNPN
jgi:hypothetical protein